MAQLSVPPGVYIVKIVKYDLDFPVEELGVNPLQQGSEGV
jgi:hypothetical protein